MTDKIKLRQTAKEVIIAKNDLNRIILLARRIKWEYDKTPQIVTESALEILDILMRKDGG